jgi:hypothetical protein
MAAAQGLDGVLDPAGQPLMDPRVEAAHRAKQPNMIRDHIESLAPFDLAEADHDRMEGIESTADGLLQTAHHPRRNPDRIGALVGAGPMAALAQHLNLQFAGSSGKAAATNPNPSHRNAGKHMHPKQGRHPLHRAIGAHPPSALGRFLRRLEQQPHPGGELISTGAQQGRHPQPHSGVNVVAAGMHQALLG